jgi:hypothetical protein
MDPKEVARITAIRAALVQTTATAGWAYIKQMSENVVAKAIQDALDAEDETGEAKRFKASSLQKGFRDLFNAIEVTKSFNPDQKSDDSGLGDLGEPETKLMADEN